MESTMIKFFALIIALATVVQAAMLSDTCNQNTWVTNGPVNAIATAGDKVYIGGQFTQVGPYIGGVFDSTHSVSRNCIAALDATTGKALDWNPNANDRVWSIIVSGSTVYVGGDFTSIGGQNRNHIAALDATTGNALAWNANTNGGVYALGVSGTTIYAGGGFFLLGGQPCTNICALNATTGDVLAWKPGADGYIYSLAVNETTVYAGGYFGSIGGQNRHNIAALDAITGNATAWNANTNGEVYALAVSGPTVYVGGKFTSISGQSRRCIAALDATTGNALAWNPNIWTSKIYSPSVYTLVVNGTTIYSGGDFDSVGRQSRSYITALDATTGNTLPWNPNANGQVQSLAMNGATLFAGGQFTSIGQGIGHPYFAKFDSSYNSPVIRSILASSSSKNSSLKIISSNSRSGALVKFIYILSKADYVSLRLYTLNGQLQSELVNKHQPAGNYSLSMQGGNLATGAYLVAFKSGDYHQEKMIFLMK